MQSFENYLLEAAEKFNIDLTAKNIEDFIIYKDFLLEYNSKVNMTAITDPKDIVIKHFIDSISVIKFCNVKENAKIIDVGTGAGFPGVPIKVVRNDIDLTLLDSLNKRICFLNQLMQKLKLESQLIHGRAEIQGKTDLREQFNLVVSRAVAPLNVLSEYCLPLVNVGGQFICMKGPNVDDEIKNSINAISILGGELSDKFNFKLPDNSVRNIIVINKIKSTPISYPRSSNNIKRKSL